MENVITNDADFGEIIRRRAPIGITTVCILAVITAVLALGLPSYFKSRAVILIEAQEMPQDLVRSMVTSFADERIQVISQRVLTNSNLIAIIDKYDLYEDERKSYALEIILEKMKKDISITPISAEVADPKVGRSIQATIAFELAYENKSPTLAQRVANEIVSLFLSENLRQRTETSAETLKFFNSESEKLRTQVTELESKLAEFKSKNVEQLPELTNLNFELMNRTDDDIRSIDTQIRSLEQQRVYLESELAQQKPTMGIFSETGERILGPADRLKVLESEFAPLAARYGVNHPDVLTKKREIDSLREMVGGAGSNGELSLKLTEAQASLGVVEKKYSSEHPDVKRLRREVASLQERVVAGQQLPATPRFEARPDNPAFIELSARLQGTMNDLRGLQGQRLAILDKRAQLERRITSSPEVERQYRGLSRDYESAQRKYQEIIAKLQEAEVGSSLESAQKGERFTLIEPPVVPEEPSKPNRLAIAVLGGLFSLVAGVGLTLVVENTDDKLYGRGGVARALGVPPLASIPEIQTAASLRDRTNRLIGIAAMLSLVLIAIAMAVHFLVRPLDVMFYQIVRRVFS